MDCCLPISFQLQTQDLKNITIEAGPENENERFNAGGQSITQKTQVYEIFCEKNEKLNIVDTPGLGDSRGSDQDLQNVEYIKEAIIEIEELHAICFVMPSNISKLTTHFEVIMRDLLSLFPKTALKNVFFFFTYANLSFFAIGDTVKPLEEFIKNFKETNNAEIPFGPENVFCVDSEAFMYRLATENGYKYQHRTEDSFRESWDKSKESINKFLQKLKTVEPIKSADIQMNFELEKCVKRLTTVQELSPEMKNISNLMAQTFCETSMSSFSPLNGIPLTKEEFEKSKKDASDFCKKMDENVALKANIEEFLKHYYNVSVKNDETCVKDGSPMSAEIKKELEEMIKILAQFLKHNDALSSSGDSRNDIINVFTAFHSDEILSNFESSITALQKYFSDNENTELKLKTERILSLINSSKEFK
uniref:AIG1-type G domain-containing protein n=1 Tax=Panagrolaimus davidi TaxID=227884 RepID=A0A914NXE7_9BILA